MNYSNIIAEIDAEISRLEQVRGFLIDEPTKKRPGRPKKTVTDAIAKDTKPERKGGMSAEGKARIAAAQKARWAKVNATRGTTLSVPALAQKVVAKKTVKKSSKK